MDQPKSKDSPRMVIEPRETKTAALPRATWKQPCVQCSHPWEDDEEQLCGECKLRLYK